MADPTSIKSSPKPPPPNRSRSRTPPSPNAPRLEEVEIDDWAARLNSGGTQRQASEKRPHPFANGAKGWATRPGIRLKTEGCGTRRVSAPPAGTRLLFYSDCCAYLSFDKPITGQQYFKLPNGPAPRRLKPIVAKMQEAEELAYQEIEFHGHLQRKPIALRQPDLDLFSPQEIDLVHTMIMKYCDYTASEISDKSHLFLGWKAAREQEEIPYSTALIGSRKPREEERAYGFELEPLAVRCLASGRG